jgi:predicted RNase H-like HicB family nuclease
VVIHFTIDIVVEPDDDRFHAFCPALKGLHVDGRTEREALKNAIDGAALYLESSLKHGDPIPVGVTVEHVPTGHQANHEGTHAHRRNLALSLT